MPAPIQVPARRFALWLLPGLFLSGCLGSFGAVPAVTPTPAGVSSAPRQFDPAAPFLPGVEYPPEILALADSDLVPLACTPEYFSWSGTGHELVEPTTQAPQPLADPRLEAFLEAARALNPGQIIVAIFLCDPPDGLPLVFYRVGPCGGGCAGIPNLAQGQPDGSLELLAIVEPEGDGAYFGCAPLQLTRDGTLYLTCTGEGTAGIRRVNLATGQGSVMLACQVLATGAACTAE